MNLIKKDFWQQPGVLFAKKEENIENRKDYGGEKYC